MAMASAQSCQLTLRRSGERGRGVRGNAIKRCAAMRKDSYGKTQDVKRVWRECDAVCFDVDSTVCRDEGIDELAAYLGKAEEVAAWTKKAMDGGVSFREALSARLELIAPGKSDVDSYLAESEPKLSDGMVELAAALHQRNKKVFLVSGGFRYGSHLHVFMTKTLV